MVKHINKQEIAKQPTIYLSVFDHFLGLMLKSLKNKMVTWGLDYITVTSKNQILSTISEVNRSLRIYFQACFHSIW